MAELQGYSQLQARFAALQGPEKMRLMAAVVRGELVRATPRRTGLTGNSWQVASVSPRSARLTGSIVNLYLDEGTGLYGPLHHLITPKAKKALAFAAGPAGSLRLSGSIRSGRAGAGAGLVVVRSVRGMRPRHNIRKAVRSASGKLGAGVVQKVWDDGA